jgi:mono/diheme cytochrome c family protein
MPQHEDKVMLKRDTCGGGRRAGVTATMKSAVKPWTPFRSRARLVALLAVLVCLGAAMAGTPARAAEQDAAEQSFQVHCAMCHGPDGKGDTVIGKSAGIPDLHAAAVQQQSDEAMAEFIANGKGVMPPFKNSLSSEQIHGLVGHVRALAQQH